MASSGVFSFNPTIDAIITDAWERCGIEGSDISAQMWDSSLFSFNMVLAETTNMQLNLWEVEPILISLQEGVRDYQLPDGTVDILEAYRRTYTRVLGGTPATSALGTASYAFDGDITTSCTQTSTNGNISYDYGSGNTNIITTVGYCSNVDATLTLVWEGSNDGSAWTQIVARGSYAYKKSVAVWDIVRLPAAYRYYRVRETAGGTLNAQEVYLGNAEKDYVLGRMSRENYDSIAIKSSSGIPVSYFVERAISPYIHIYQTPDAAYPMLRANRIRQIYSVTGATQTLDTAFRFLEAFVAMLAVKLAIKKAPERLAMLAEAAKVSVKLAQEEDRERVTARFVPDMSGYRI